MACPRFEDLISGGDQAARHAANCEECRALLEALAEVDATLEAAFEGVSAPPGLSARAFRQAAFEARLQRPSLLPEVLDFIGWAAVLTLAAVLLPRFLPAIQAALASLG